MELIATRRDEQPVAEGLSQATWAVALRRKYGDADNLMRRYSVKNAEYCANNIAKLTEAPSLVRVRKAFGDETAVYIISEHITMAIGRMGEDRNIDAVDVQSLAHTIATDTQFSLLKLPTIIKFFHELPSGKPHTITFATPYKIATALRKCYSELMDEQWRAEREAERKAKEAMQSPAVSYEEFAKRNGIKEKTMSEYIINQVSKKKDD